VRGYWDCGKRPRRHDIHLTGCPRVMSSVGSDDQMVRDDLTQPAGGRSPVRAGITDDPARTTQWPTRCPDERVLV
jgi:hypothetical protein